MKKHIFILLACLVSLNFYSQVTDSIKPVPDLLPKLSFDVSYGLANLQQLGVSKKNDSPNFSTKWFGPCFAKVNIKLNKDAAITIMYGYTVASATLIYNAQNNVLVTKTNSLGIRYTLYIIQKPKFNFYAGIGGGAVFGYTDASQMHIGYYSYPKFSPYYFDLIAGVSYQILKPISLFADAGVSHYSLLQVGLRVAIKN